MTKTASFSVDRLVNRFDVSRPMAIEILRDLQAKGIGSFKIGRRGHPSRLEVEVSA
jgi:hypothetical protein